MKPANKVVRISFDTWKVLRKLSYKTGKKMGPIAGAAVKEYAARNR